MLWVCDEDACAGRVFCSFRCAEACSHACAVPNPEAESWTDGWWGTDVEDEQEGARQAAADYDVPSTQG
jgi:hypothetical protein